MHVALLILLTVFITQLISWLRKDQLLDVSHAIYLRIFHSRTLRRQRELKAEIFANKQDLAKTSSQDEFSKWARLRRKVDKGLQELEAVNSTLANTRTSFSMLFKAALFILTTGVPFAITTYHRKTPVFWLPPGGWLGPLGWFLSFPSAPAGAISSSVWSTVCKRVLGMLESTFKDLINPSAPAPTPAAASQANTKPKPSGPSPAAPAEKDIAAEAALGAQQARLRTHGVAAEKAARKEAAEESAAAAASAAATATATETMAKRRTARVDAEEEE